MLERVCVCVCVCELTGGLGAAEDESRDVDESTS